MQIDLTDQEASVLLTIIDIAVKAKGMEAAEAGLHLTRKIQEAAKAKAGAPANSNIVDLDAAREG